jgi:hypothetical protein
MGSMFRLLRFSIESSTPERGDGIISVGVYYLALSKESISHS